MCNSKPVLLAFVLAVAVVVVFPASAADWPRDEDFIVLSGSASPRVALALNRSADPVLVVVDVAAFAADGSGTTVAVGLAAGKKSILDGKGAKITRGKGAARHSFAVPAASLATQDAQWARLRLAVAVAWAGGPLGKDRQQERFRHAGATHGTLSPDEKDWLPLDVAEYEAGVSDRRNRIVLDFNQPMDGKATIIIEDAKGRVRNLIAGQPLPNGRQQIAWDGLDEAGNPVPPGTYAWRAISHPGITPDYLFSFCNDGQPPWRNGSGRDMWGPDHSCLTAAPRGRTARDKINSLLPAPRTVNIPLVGPVTIDLRVPESVPLPSFGGNFEQIFQFNDVWCCPKQEK